VAGLPIPWGTRWPMLTSKNIAPHMAKSSFSFTTTVPLQSLARLAAQRESPGGLATASHTVGDIATAGCPADSSITSRGRLFRGPLQCQFSTSPAVLRDMVDFSMSLD